MSQKLPKTLLIHGFGMRLHIPGVFKSKFGEDAFGGFKEMFEQGQATIFDWSEQWKIPWWKLINRSPYHLYFLEKRKVQGGEILNQLENILEAEKPELLVCHSMGCFLLLNYLKQYNLPNSVNKIVFAQGDFERGYKLENTDLIERSKTGSLKILNTYCIWDQALLNSIFLNFYLPAGQFGWSEKHVKNHFFALKKSANLHQGILQDQDFYELCLGLNI